MATKLLNGGAMCSVEIYDPERGPRTVIGKVKVSFGWLMLLREYHTGQMWQLSLSEFRTAKAYPPVPIPEPD